jgi:predicted MPP superfamily phosphohydrolase
MPTVERLDGEAAGTEAAPREHRRRRTPRGLLVSLVIFLGLVGGAHVYFARRLVLATAVPEPWDGYALIALTFGAATLLAGPLAERRLPPSKSRLFAWPAYLWMGACFYLLVGLWTSDLVMMLGGFEGLAADQLRATVVVGVTALAVAAGIPAAIRIPRVKRLEIALPHWPAQLDGYRVAQISDIHVGPILRGPWVERLVARVNALQPDLIAVTGDLVDGDVPRLAPHVDPFRALSARDGVYFVTGNHEYFSNVDPWAAHAAQLGWTVLRNVSVRVRRDGAVFDVAGVDDLSSRRRGGSRGGHDLPAALDACEPQVPVVLLAHNPNTFLEARGKVALQLSGHTHGGQIWPFGGLVRLTTPYLAGTYRSGTSTLYVSRGTGFWGPPMRVFAPAEITELVLRSA